MSEHEASGKCQAMGNTVPGQIELFSQIRPFNLALYRNIGGWRGKILMVDEFKAWRFENGRVKSVFFLKKKIGF